MTRTSDFYELALILCGMNPDDDADFENERKVTLILYDKYGLDNDEQFERLIKDLVKLIHIERTALTGLFFILIPKTFHVIEVGVTFHGLVDDERHSYNYNYVFPLCQGGKMNVSLYPVRNYAMFAKPGYNKSENLGLM